MNGDDGKVGKTEEQRGFSFPFLLYIYMFTYFFHFSLFLFLLSFHLGSQEWGGIHGGTGRWIGLKYML